MATAEAFITSTPRPTGHLKKFIGGMADEEPSVIKGPKSKKSYLDMVVEAINTIGLPKKGASYQAIKKWIIENKVDTNHTTGALKIALKRGIDEGILLRPAQSKSVVGARGYFVTKPVKSSKPPASKTVIISAAASKKKVNKKAPPSKTSKSPKQVKMIKGATTASAYAKAKLFKNPTSKALANAEAKLTPKSKVPAKARLGKKVIKKDEEVKEAVLEVPSKAVKKVATKPSKDLKVPSKSKPLKVPSKDLKVPSKDIKVPPKVKASKFQKKNIPTDAGEATNFSFVEDQANVGEIAEVAKVKKANVKATGKIKVPRNDSNLENEHEVKSKKAKMESKNIDNTKSRKKIIAHENERLDFSDSELVIKDKRATIHKSFSSDTELEVKKLEIKKRKRTKKVTLQQD